MDKKKIDVKLLDNSVELEPITASDKIEIGSFVGTDKLIIPDAQSNPGVITENFVIIGN